MHRFRFQIRNFVGEKTCLCWYREFLLQFFLPWITFSLNLSLVKLPCNWQTGLLWLIPRSRSWMQTVQHSRINQDIDSFLHTGLLLLCIMNNRHTPACCCSLQCYCPQSVFTFPQDYCLSVTKSCYQPVTCWLSRIQQNEFVCICATVWGSINNIGSYHNTAQCQSSVNSMFT